jgi:hypothetical protein
VWTLSAWPIVLVNPWLQRRLSAWLDRPWLGRRFTPIEASERFLDGLQGAPSANRVSAAGHALARRESRT